MSNKLHNFDWMRNEFMEAIRASVKTTDAEPVFKLFDSLHELDIDKRAAVDQGFRDYLLLLLGESQPPLVWHTFLSRCVDVCRREMATVTMPIVLLGDIFDSLTLDQCEKLFPFVEDNVAIWKEDLFFTACKNNLLRMCNDLLRRLSRSKNTVFCGRILLFLAKFFPFSERSGLNVVSEFNLENVTEYNADDSMDNQEDEKLDDTIEDGGADKLKIDYNLYNKFWSLQNFFRNPLLVYNKAQWKTFVAHTENVLSAFKSFKLEGVNCNKKLQGTGEGETKVTESLTRDHYFAKFLTNQKLLELQLSDVNFRRYVLVQFLILFQYLNAPVKFKSDNQELKSQESGWVKDTTEEVYNLLKETPPDGETFTQTVQHILKREEYWNSWKNDGCQDFKKLTTPMEDSLEEDKRVPKRAKKRLGQLIKEGQAHKKIIMGIPELTKLWTYNSDNLEACRAPERNFLMSLEEYFKEAIEQLDPAAMVEDQYKVVNDGNFGWRALRLLALQSSHFFTHSNNTITQLPAYLEAMIKKIAKERPIISEEVKQETYEGNTVLGNEAETEALEEDELLKGDEKRDEISNSEDRSETPDATQKAPGITAKVLDAVAQKVEGQWRDLAEKMGFKDTIQYIEGSLKSDLERARYVLQLWTEDEMDLTPEAFVKALENFGFSQAAAIVTSHL